MDESQAAHGVTIADGRMTIEGIPAAYVQDPGRPLVLAAEALRFVGGFAAREGRLEDKRRIEAQARIVDGGLRRAGREGTATRLHLTLRPLQAVAEETRLLLAVGWREEDDGLAFAEAFLPVAVFEALKADLLAGLADELSLRASTSLWIRESDRERATDRPVDRYLAPDGETGETMSARGFIDTLDWRPPTGPQRETADQEADAVPAPAAPSVVASAAEEAENETAEELRRINWSFRQLLVLLAFLLIILAIK
jgi:hypothetical protein